MVRIQRPSPGAQSHLAHDDDFAALIRSQPPLTDDHLAELIELDGRARLDAGVPVSLTRYLRAIPDLPQRVVPLDAAIDMVLRSLAGGAPPASAVQRLEQRYPHLVNAIREAAALGDALCSTSALAARLKPKISLTLPAELGVALADGRPRYLLTEDLGGGSQGQVFLATDRLLSEPDMPAKVAIKILSLDAPHLRGRLAEEATKARRINHPNVVRALDRGTTSAGDEYIVYEYVPGGDLSTFLAARGLPLPPELAASLVSQIARGVQSAHAAGLVHCDLKPGNIIMDGSTPKVADFGVAVRIGSDPPAQQPVPLGVGLGNIAFMSPEQFQLHELGATIPSDIYSLGGLLYYLVTGLLPNGSNFDDIRAHLQAAASTPPPSIRSALPQLDRDLDHIARRALARQPHVRHQSAGEFADDLDRWLKREPIPWTRPSTTRVLHLALRRHPWNALVGAFLLLGIGIALGIEFHIYQQAQEERIAEARRAVATNRSLGAIEDLYSFLLKRREAPRVSSIILSQGLLTQWAMGPDIFKHAHHAPAVWKDRIELGRSALSEHAGLQPGSLEALLWESSLAYWLVCNDSPDAALDILSRNRQAWAAKVDPSDQWLLQLEALEACALIRRELARHATGAPADMTTVTAAERTLCGESTLFGPDPTTPFASSLRGPNEGTGLQILILQTLMDLYSSSIRHDIARRNQAERRLDLYLAREKPAER